jgi:molecular chaperone DnaK
MQEDAEGHAEEDKKKKESVDIKNEAESFIYTTEKLVNQDLKDKIPQEKGIQITDAIKELKDILSQDTEQIKPKLEALKAIVNEVTTELYKNASPPPGEQKSDSNEEKSYANEEKSDSNEEKSDSNEQKSDSNSEQKSENNSN